MAQHDEQQFIGLHLGEYNFIFAVYILFCHYHGVKLAVEKAGVYQNAMFIYDNINAF